MSMSMSSPFSLSCRRRSHSESSPSPSPIPACTWRPAHKRAHSSHRDTPTLLDSQRCHLDIWRTGKRPRRDISPVQATRSSTPASTDSTTSSSSSTPHTPFFPASSADFLFPSHSLCRGNPSARNLHSPSPAVSFFHDDTCEPSQMELARLRSKAFSELQRSVRENGEGFVKRMREFEDSRSKFGQNSRPRGVERRRKTRYSPSVPTVRSPGNFTISDDVLIFSNTLESGSIGPRQRRSSSLGAVDDSDLQLYGASNPSGRLSPISSTFHSVPLAHYASHVHPTITHSTELSTSFGTYFDFTNPRHTNAFNSAAPYPSSDAPAPSADVDVNYTFPISYSASSTEKAIAALTLAMANGAGSLGDYEAVRALDVSSTDESQVGELWH